MWEGLEEVKRNGQWCMYIIFTQDDIPPMSSGQLIYFNDLLLHSVLFLIIHVYLFTSPVAALIKVD